MPIVRETDFEAGEWLGRFPRSRRFGFFDETALDLLHEISRRLMAAKAVRQFPDLVTFAYFCRRSNLLALQQRVADREIRRGWGTVLHVAPSNIPINFAFSFAFSLLAGNSNIVRLPSRPFAQIELFLDVISALTDEPRFAPLMAATVFARCTRGSRRLTDLVASADGLVVWGGDATVTGFRALPKKPRCVEVYFPDRASSAAIDAAAYDALDAESRTRLAQRFYNDTYLVDQNACSSPSKLFWVGTGEAIETARTSFWGALAAELAEKRYRLDPVARIDRHLDVIAVARAMGGGAKVDRHAPDIWIVRGDLPAGAPLRFGQFCEISVSDPTLIGPHLRPQEQTLTYFGLDPDALWRAIADAGLSLVDRIVPIGRALDIGPFWDGKDILSLLSRRVDITRP